MTIDFYYLSGSSPCRAVMLTAKALGVELNKKVLNLMEGEHLKPEFVKINPQHCIPTMVDDGFALWESRAICVYLVTKYGKDDSLYPNDAKKRGLVEQRLNFDLGTLYQRMADIYYPVLFHGQEKIDEEKVKKLKEALELLDGFLANSKWAAGDQITVADHSLVASVGSIDAVGVDLSPYKNVTKWYKQSQDDMPGFQEANQEGVEAFREMVKKILAAKK